MLPLLLILPLSAAALMPLVSRVRKGLPDILCPLVLATTLGLALSRIPVMANGGIDVWNSTKVGLPLALSLRMDGLSFLLVTTIGLIAFFASVFSIHYMRHYTGRAAYSALFLLMVTGMYGLVLTTDLFSLYVFLEVAAVASYSLVAFSQKHEGVEAAFKYLMLSAPATTGTLLAISFIYLVVGTLDIGMLGQAVRTGMEPGLIALCLAFFLLGFGLKAALVPFHAWLPDAHPAAPAPISAMLSGVLIKVSGVYALIRVVYDVLGLPPAAGQALIALGVLSMVVGALVALGQDDFKRMLAYSSISQIGYIAIGLGVGTPLGILGALFHLFNHATFKGLLFLDAGATEYATGTRSLSKLGGIGKKMPITGLTTTIGTFSIAGVPPFNGFWSKFFVILALVEAHMYWIAALAVATSILTLAYFLIIQRRAFFGKLAAGFETLREVPISMTFATMSLATLCLVAGLFYPWITDHLIQPGVASLTQAVGTSASMLTGP